MNEKLTVRNFGPITEAEVEFKRVTVFIGPTGGGKSTLAKLAAIVRNTKLHVGDTADDQQKEYETLIEKYELVNFVEETSYVGLEKSGRLQIQVKGKMASVIESDVPPAVTVEHLDVKLYGPIEGSSEADRKANATAMLNAFINALSSEGREMFFERVTKIAIQTIYLPADRAFAASAHGALAGLQASNVALPKTLLDFLAVFESARKHIIELPLPFFNVTYKYRENTNQLELKNGKSITLSEGASGLQVVVPLLLSVEYKFQERKNSKIGATRFIAEEPELNLFPIAQKHVLETLINRCTKDEDEIIINTHSPYILSHLNLLLYAHQVATQYPDRSDEVAQLVPRESWINPQEFAAYYVGEGTARSIVNAELGLIDDNELDAISGDQADAFDNLIRLSKGFAVK